MDKLTVPLSSVSEHGLEIHRVVSETDLRPEPAPAVNVGRIRVDGTLSEADREYLFRGTISGEYIGACDRCLTQVQTPFNFDVLWVFAPGGALEMLDAADEEEFDQDAVDIEDGEVVPFSGSEIDLGPRVWEEIVLGLPTKWLCDVACKGLCPYCGVDLNRGACPEPEACKLQESRDTFGSSGLSGLKDMFPDLKRGKSEE